MTEDKTQLFHVSAAVALLVHATDLEDADKILLVHAEEMAVVLP